MAQKKFQIAYQGTLDYFCGIYAVINATGFACSSIKILTAPQKEEFFRYFMKYLLDNGLLAQVIDHGTTCQLEERYLRLAQKYMKEKHNILIQWKKLSSLKSKKPLSFAQIFYLLNRWVRLKNHSCIIRVDTPQTGDHWTVFKRVNFPISYLVDSYHFLKINFKKLAWKVKEAKNLSSETQIMKQGIFFIKATSLK